MIKMPEIDLQGQINKKFFTHEFLLRSVGLASATRVGEGCRLTESQRGCGRTGEGLGQFNPDWTPPVHLLYSLLIDTSQKQRGMGRAGTATRETGSFLFLLKLGLSGYPMSKEDLAEKRAGRPVPSPGTAQVSLWRPRPQMQTLEKWDRPRRTSLDFTFLLNP